MGAEAPHAVAKARPLIQTLGHMESLFALVYATSLIAFWSGIATTILRFVQMVSRLSALDAVRFAAVSVALAVVSYVLAALIGAWAFCLGSAGGLCALGGYIGTGLLVAGAVLLYRSLRARRELAAT
jgi:hypothetical protein